VDLVKAQINTAQNKPLFWDQEDLVARGHAIECRIYAEDAFNKGMPSTGKLGYCYYPMGPGRRFEIGFREGDEITSFYDSMIAKIVTWDENRPRAIQKMIRTLKDTIIFGVKTNIPYLLEIVNHPDFTSGEMTTQFIEKYFPNGLEDSDLSSLEKNVLKQASRNLADASSASTHIPSPWEHSWEVR